MRKTRSLKKAIAVVGEGQTEWLYFDYIRRTRRYSFSLKPDLPKHSDYKMVFDKAKQLIKQNYDLVFCVIDVDTVCNTGKLEEFKRVCTKLPGSIVPITSSPCIEIWFLMHYLSNPSSKVYETYASLLLDLQKYIPDYDKNKDYLVKHDVFARMEENAGLVRALKNAKKMLETVIEGEGLGQSSYSEICLVIQQLEKCRHCPFIKDCSDCSEKISALF